MNESNRNFSLQSSAAPICPELAVPRVLAPRTRLAGRFVIEGKLGQGGMGQVFAALDTQRATRVAVKILGRRTPHSITEIKREFRAAADIVHPNLVRMRELLCDGADWFFSMDLVEGKQLDELLQRAGTKSPRTLLRIFEQLASALLQLHRFGIMHRDLKPSNFLVCGPEHRVVLLDFGLAQPFGPDADGDIVGTPAYMAPEQLLGEPLDEATDWYAFGVVLYEALTGKLPPRKREPDDLSEVPSFLRDLCKDLLERSPSRRPSGKEVLHRIGARPRALQMSALPAIRAQSLIGRSIEMEDLLAAFAETLTGSPALALIEGPSGIGKSALMESFVALIQRRGAFVLSGRCRERESMAYKAVDGLLDDIVELLDSLSGPRSLPLPEHVAELTVVFPALRAARALNDVEPVGIDMPDPAVVRRRAVAAFRDILAWLRSHAPIVLWIDDLQWSDEESSLFVGPLLGGSSPIPILFAGSHRDGPGQRGAMLDAMFSNRALRLPQARSLSLGTLPPDDAAHLARQLLPPAHSDLESLALSIADDAGGHPLFIAELAAWASSSNLSGAYRHRTLAELVSNRVAAMPEQARELLEVAAVAGIPYSRGVLRKATSLDQGQSEDALDLLRACRLARSGGLTEEALIDLHHDRIREVVIQGITLECQARHHRNFARVLATLANTPPETLATHYEAGGQTQLATRYTILAADQAMRTLGFEHAAQLYDRAFRFDCSSPEERQGLRLRQATALAQAGRGPAAADLYLDAAKHGADESTEFLRRAAEQLLISGHLDRGLAVIEGVLRASKMRVPTGDRSALLRIALGRLAVRLRGLRHTSRSEHEVSRRELAKIDVAWTIASSLGPVDFLRGAEFQISHLLAALKAGEPRRLLRALSLEMPYVAAGARSTRRTAHLLAEAERLVRVSDDIAAVGLLHAGRGLADYLRGRLSSALSHLERALAIHSRCTGVIWEMVSEQRFIVSSLFFLGRFQRLAEFVPPLIAEAEGKGNAYAAICFRAGYGTTAFLGTNQVAEARRQLERASDEWKVTGFRVPHTHMLIASSYCDFYEGEMERPLSSLRSQWPRMAEAGVLRIGILRIQLLQLRAAAALGSAQLQERLGRKHQASELRRAARVDARALSRERIQRGPLLASIIEAGICHAEGRRGRAERLLRGAVAAADAQELGAIRDAARVRLGQLVGGTEGEALVRRGLDGLHGQGVARPERMVDALVPGYMDS